MTNAAPDRLIRRPEVESRTGLKRSTMYVYINRGNFPRPVPLGTRAVAWLSSEIDAWIEARIRAARGGAAPENRSTTS
jgi:prophage regulatory protein